MTEETKVQFCQVARYQLTPSVELGEVILENSDGVQIREGHKTSGHYLALYAGCHCGEHLYVAPMIFMADHKKGDPVLVCADNGVHAFRFLELTKGKQAPPLGFINCQAADL